MPQPPKTDRDAVLRCALGVLEAEGPEAVTIRRVARELGVAPSALYWHVTDREALLSGVAGLGIEELRQALAPASDEVELSAVAQAYLRFARTRRHLYELVMSPRTPDSHADLWHDVVALLEPETGPAEAPAVAITLWAYLHGVAGLATIGPFGPEKPTAALERGVDVLLQGMARLEA